MLWWRRWMAKKEKQDETAVLLKAILYEAEFHSTVLRRIYNRLRNIDHRLFPAPTTLTINLKGDPMASPKTYPVGTTVVSLPATEFDTLVTPPAPFTYAK